MVKQWGFVTLILSLLFLYTGWDYFSEKSARQDLAVTPLVKAFQSSDMIVDKWMIHHGASLHRPLTDQQLKRLTHSSRLKNQSAFHLIPNDNQSERVFTADWGRNIQFEIRVIRRGHEKPFVNDYLVVKMKASEDHAESLPEAATWIADHLQEAGLDPRLHVSVQGSTPKVLPPVKRQSLIRQTMQTLDASEVEAVNDLTMISVSAFSPQLGDPIVSDGQEMNVQIAARSDDVTKRTVLTMGTPMITIEY